MSEKPLSLRTPMRLCDYDYARAGWYFITICTRERQPVLGEIEGAQVRRSDAGRMVEEEWLELAVRFPGVEIDEYILMPDHLHGILVMSGAPVAGGLSNVIGGFKSVTTRRYMRGVHEQGWPRFDRHLWQRSFYDHVIRNEISLQQTREYIRTNPLRWWLRHAPGE